MKENYIESLNWIDKFIKISPSKGIQASAYAWKAFYDMWLGKYEQSVVTFKKALELFEDVEHKFGPVYVYLQLAWLYHNKGDLKKSYEEINKLHNFSKEHFPNWTRNRGDVLRCLNLGFHYIELGQIDSAKQEMTKLNNIISKTGSSDNEFHEYYKNILNAELLLSENKIDQAIQVGQQIIPKKLPSIQEGSLEEYNLPFPRDVLARAYQKKGEVDKAISEYEKLISFDQNRKGRILIRPEYHYKLAKLYKDKGQREKAIIELEKFLEIWKNADKDLPELIDAKKQLNQLKNYN